MVGDGVGVGDALGIPVGRKAQPPRVRELTTVAARIKVRAVIPPF
jgi:hypothetical protein